MKKENKEEGDPYLYICEHARKSGRIQELTNRGTCMRLVKALLSSYSSLHSGFSCLIEWKRTELREMCKELAPAVHI